MKINNVNNQYQYKNQRNVSKQQETPAFKGGVPQPIVNGLSDFYTGVAKTSGFQGFIKNFSKSNKTFTYLLVAESCFLSGFYMINTLRNKKIKKEQKPQMLINDTLTLGVSTAGACLAEDKITDVVMKASEKYFTKHSDFYTQLGQKAQETAASTPKGDLLSKVGEITGKTGDELSKGVDDVASMLGGHLKGIIGEEGKQKAFQISSDTLKNTQESIKTAITENAGNAEKAQEKVKELVDDLYSKSAARAEADKVLPGINKLKVLVIFGIIYRYLGPVVITPIANKLSSKLLAHKQEKADKTEAKK
jgi:hypothetical protein